LPNGIAPASHCLALSVTAHSGRHVFGALFAALPPAIMAAQFAYALYAPDSSLGKAWTEDALRLVLLEFFLMLAGPNLVWAAENVRDYRETLFAAGSAALWLALLFGVWHWTGDVLFTSAAGLLLGGRVAAALLAGPARRHELTERALLGFIVYVALALALIFFTKSFMEFFDIEQMWVVFCVVYYFLLTCIEAVDLFPKWREPVIRRPMRYLHKPRPMAGGAVRLVFAGDAFELVTDLRMRPVMRVLAVVVGAAVVTALLISLHGKIRLGLQNPGFWICTAIAAYLLWLGLRRRADTRHVQIGRGEIAILETTRGRVSGAKAVSLRDIEKFEIAIASLPPSELWMLMLYVRGAFAPTILVSYLPKQEVAALQRLFERYLSGNLSPEALRKWFAVDGMLVHAIGGAHIAGRVVDEAAKAAQGTPPGQIHCPDCAGQVAASTTRCPYCGLLRPGL